MSNCVALFERLLPHCSRPLRCGEICLQQTTAYAIEGYVSLVLAQVSELAFAAAVRIGWILVSSGQRCELDGNIRG
jgi:hypothetical protein